METAPFHLADSYARMLAVQPSAVLEPGVPYRSGFHWTERHLQCLWFDTRYRPAVFPLPGGEAVTVLSPGEWNLEAGPDFLNATLLIQPGARQVRGDVEVHVHPSDWDAHRHWDDPAYAHVIAHVTWFSGPPPRTLPSGVCSLSLAAPLLSQSGISIDDIDLKAYPHAVLPSTPRPCEGLLKRDPDRARAVLAAAGQYRMRAKAARILARLEQCGDRHQVFYEEVMAALGYKHNQAPFRTLARLLPVATLGTLRDMAFARMLGTARLLPQPDAAPDEEGQRLIRALWNLWWREAGETLPDAVTWRLHNLRPQNAPVRRLAAAASLFSGMATVRHDLDRIAGESGLRWHSQALDCFEARCRWAFWNRRLSFASMPDAEQDVALLGESRTAAILTNVVLPFAAAEGALPNGMLEDLPPEDLSAPMRLTALHLFGRDHNPALYADSGLLQQGLLQIHIDFCLNAKPGCDACALCQTLATQAAGHQP
ncbi:MAG TPA: DUF2851 family protein [Kiritimatiellia bacterium]|nr:DUF2851 family protein [Kiritimatiellia bacterium]HPS08893.1 DUF2851 family protein [Kiritimatiellia bacterium]